MFAALRLAEKGRFSTAPNPCVGAVLVRDGEVAAQGFHTRCGAPHAEVAAIANARELGVDLSQSELYVTLEPCNHHGKTPPCTEAILKAGIQRVCIGALDPNPDVAGGGAQRLRDAGVEVRVGELGEQCRDVIADFLTWKDKQRPFVLLKLAATLDGKIAAASGHSKWISSEASRTLVHQLRSKVDAVLVGGNTLHHDDPQLTPRLGGDAEGTQTPPLAVAVTSRLPEPGSSFLTRERPGETIFFTGPDNAGSEAAKLLMKRGCRVPQLGKAGNEVDLKLGLEYLYEHCGCRYVLCEGGGLLAGSLLDAGLADHILLFLAPKIAGDVSARPMVAGRGLADMSGALDLRIIDSRMLGPDLLVSAKPGQDLE
ncbi:MAG: bifunctional diaminohydroxyphosphoribosylaminopyrimidine deaminase/5-amino-6-(5-phosphoribosylamino)uracil reductase RibD [Desulfovibrio sp.]|nr:MAG: bifunctional diaminohydroxyphosphoribosylaminopyrimidine deaminase/5-amino-6-(5-phosphoribosylamino)uracil reductase RibD [Desulfovibrio sp.]